MIYVKKDASVRDDLVEGAHAIVWDEAPTEVATAARSMGGTP